MEEKTVQKKAPPKVSTPRTPRVKKAEVLDVSVITAVGRRKSAIARIRLVPGNGDIVVNDKPFAQYFPLANLQQSIEKPMILTSTRSMYSVSAKVNGGGVHGQADSVRLGIARALLKINPDFRKTLRSEGLLTRDPRIKERKKPGLKRARRAPQFSKR